MARPKTVGDLLEKLKNLPPDKQIVFMDSRLTVSELDGVREFEEGVTIHTKIYAPEVK